MASTERRMASAIIEGAAQPVEASKSGPVAVADSEEEEEEELFEIDIDIVNCIPPPHYHWETYFTATGCALLANCLLPIADLSTAVPIQSSIEYKHREIISLFYLL